MLKRSVHRQRGAEIVEFIVTLPVILILFALILELGVGFVNQSVLSNASRAAAREVIRGKTDAEAAQAANRVVSSMIAWQSAGITAGGCGGGDAVQVCVAPSIGSRPEGQSVTVTVSFNYQFLLLPAFASTAAGLTLSASTTMLMLPS